MKDLNYYMSLPYEVSVEKLSEDEGGGVFVYIPVLGGMAVNAHEDTYEEAMATLEEVKRDFFEMWLEAGVNIPEPEPVVNSWLDVANEYFGELVRISA